MMDGLHSTMQAVCLRQVPQGLPQLQDFELQQLPLPVPGDGQLLVRVSHLSLDPFLRAQLGGRYALPCPPLGSIVPGYGIGTVIEDRSGRFQIGDVVTGMTGWAEFATIDANTAAVVDTALAPASTAVGVLGIPGLTAWAGVRRILQPKAGQTILVSTAAGAVGSVVGQLCKAAGCRVVGIAGSAQKCAIVTDEFGFDACVSYRDADFAQALRAACADGIDGYFDNVGGAVLEAALSLLRLHARVVLCGLSDQYNRAERPAGPNLGPVIGARARLEGLVVYDHLADFAQCRAELAQMIAAGTLRYREHIHDGLAAAPAGFIGLLKGENLGKALVRLQGIRMTQIQRRFVSVNGRQVHYRIAGSGPALLLIHQSPQNSRMWAQMQQRYADRYTVIAPDTPGFGYSDALPGNPMTIAEFGAGTLQFVDALGLQRFAVFGMHTGGLIATWLAWANPSRVAALVVDGYAAFTPQESTLYGDAYLPPFVPQWDGSHLRWLWSRMREQKYYFPWYDGRAEAAMAIPPQTTESSRETVMDVLDVGDTYRAGYAAAFRHNDHHWLGELQMPSWLVYRHGDPLLAHMPRLRDLPANVTVLEEPNGIPAMQDGMDGWLAQTLTNEPAFVEAAAPALPSNTWQRRIITTGAGDMAVWERAGQGVLRLCLHAPGTRPLSPLQIDAGDSAWLLPDLPGHGASCESDGALDAATLVAALLAAIPADNALPLVIEAHGAAAGYVPALVQVLGAAVAEVVLHSPWLLTAEEQALLLQGLPSTVIDRAGGYLCDAWQWERERHLLWPWLPPSAAARRRVDAPAPARVHDNVVELLRLGSRLHGLLRDVTHPDLAARLRALPVPLRVVGDAESDYQGRAAALSA